MIRVVAVKGDLALENRTCEKGDSGGVSSLIRLVFPLHGVGERESITGGLANIVLAFCGNLSSQRSIKDSLIHGNEIGFCSISATLLVAVLIDKLGR